ncbi:carbohydrate kinase family protein [Mesoaciditoga sp.]
MKVCVIGENLIDFFKNESGFQPHVGGSSLNVAVGLSRLGVKVGYVTKFSNDLFGRMIKETLLSEGVDLSNSLTSDNLHTTLSFVFMHDEIPSFEIFNRCTADSSLEVEELSNIDVDEFEAIHFGSITLATSSVKAIFELVKRFKEAGKFVTFDPNYRRNVAENEEEYVKNIFKGWKIADVVKLSLEDAHALFHEFNLNKIIETIRYLSVPAVITKGAEGADVVIEKKMIHVKAVKTDAVDTTGCGDAFCAGMIYSLLKDRFNVDVHTLERACEVGNVVASFTAKKTGAFSSFPHFEDVEKSLST